MAIASEQRSSTAEPHAGVPLARVVGDVVRDLLVPDPRIYWTDLLASVLVANAALGFYLHGSSRPWQFVGLVVGALAYYRASIFIHELQHLRAGTFRGFRLAWYVLVGVPLLLPQFLYDEHRGHHTNRDYGTTGDAEYLQLVKQPWFSLLYMLTRIFWLPLVFILRFLVLPPLAWMSPAVRRWTWMNASTIGGINVLHHRELPSPETERNWKLQELGCFAYIAALAVLPLFDLLPWTTIPRLYVVGVIIVAVSHTRTLTSHRFGNDGREMTYVEQMLDSTTIPGRTWITPLWCPVGMRYHALHHLVPSLPYHNMAEAHRRLLERLPADSPYRATLRSGMFEALGDIVATARRVSRERRGASQTGSAA